MRLSISLLCTFIIYVYIYIIYTPNLRSWIALFDREREHGRFEGSIEGAAREQGRARGSSEGASREQEKAYRDELTLVPYLGGAQQIGA